MSKKAPVGQEGDGNSEKKKRSGETLSYITGSLSRFGGSLRKSCAEIPPSSRRQCFKEVCKQELL